MDSKSEEEGRKGTAESSALATLVAQATNRAVEAALTDIAVLRDEFSAMQTALMPAPEVRLARQVDYLEYERDVWKYTAYAFAGLFFLILFLGARRS